MKTKIEELLNEHFIPSIIKLGFERISNLESSNSGELILGKNHLLIKLEKYHKEIYVYTASRKNASEWANLFNVVEFTLKKSSNNYYKSNYFREIKDLEKCFQMQLDWILTVVKENLSNVLAFYEKEVNVEALNDYMITAYPNLFKSQKMESFSLLSHSKVPHMLDQFFKDDCGEHEALQIKDALVNKDSVTLKKFEYNRFEISLDFTANIVMLEDVLDASEAGRISMPLKQFENELFRRYP